MRRFFRIVLSLYQGYETPRDVKVKAYKRLRHGKVEKVRSHYRGVKGRRGSRWACSIGVSFRPSAGEMAERPSPFCVAGNYS